MITIYQSVIILLILGSFLQLKITCHLKKKKHSKGTFCYYLKTLVFIFIKRFLYGKLSIQTSINVY